MPAATYSDGREQIERALAGFLYGYIPPGRRFIRYRHGWTTYRGKRRYFISYTWARTHANHMTGIVYETTIARAEDFDTALALAVEKLKRIGTVTL